MCRQTVAIRFAVLIVVCLLGAAVSKQCRKLDSNVSKLCGYEYTAEFQHDLHFNSSLRAVHHIVRLIGNCSEYQKLITCSVFVPKCDEDIPGPYLPCKRVCDEYAKRCSDTIIASGLEWTVGMCQLLPKSDDPKTTKGYIGRCFEPPNFKPLPGDAEPLKCYKLVEPLCHGLGYNETLLSESNQKYYSNHMKHNIGNYTSDTKCGELRRQIVCAETFPACKDNKVQYLCRHKCNKFFDTCKSPFHYTKEMCMEFPEGNSSTGLCYQTHWPRYGNWPAPPTTEPPTETTGTTGMTTPKKPTSEPGTYEPSVAARFSKERPALVTSIVVPLAVVLTVVLVLLAFLIYRKKKRAGQFRYERHQIYTANQPDDF